MTCDEFAAHWRALVCGTLTETSRASLQDHAAECAVCGRRLREHHEVSAAVQAVLATSRLPSNLAGTIAGRVYADHFGTAVELGWSAGTGAAPASVAPSMLLLAALAGGLVGYFLGSGGGTASSNPSLWYAAMTGQMGMSPFRARGIGLPGVGLAADLVRPIFSVCLLVWATRTRLWQAIFPVKPPPGLLIVQWLVLPVALVGILQIGIGAWMQNGLWISALGGGMTPGFAPSPTDVAWWQAITLLDQLWTVGFWLTLFLLLFAVVIPALTRWAGQTHDPQRTLHR